MRPSGHVRDTGVATSVCRATSPVGASDLMARCDRFVRRLMLACRPQGFAMCCILCLFVRGLGVRVGRGLVAGCKVEDRAGQGRGRLALVQGGFPPWRDARCTSFQSSSRNPKT